MKTVRNSRQNARRLAKYLSGEMSVAESCAFEEEFSVTGENVIRIEELKKQWSAMKDYQAAKSPDARIAWNKLHERLQEEHLVPVQQVAAKSRILMPVMKIAAAVLLLAAVGAVIFWSINRNAAVEQVRLVTGSDDNTLVTTLADGSVLYIGRQTVCSFAREFNAGPRRVELQGEAFFDVAGNPEKPFTIETGQVLIRVLGTAFSVNTQNDGGAAVFVDRGSVKVTLKSDPSVSELVAAGEQISVVSNTLVKSKHEAGESSSWYKERMHFKDETLENIIHVLNVNFNTNFALADKMTGKQRLTVTFRDETAETMTELICAAMNLKSKNIHGEVILFENRGGEEQP